MSDWVKFTGHHRGRKGLGPAIVICANGKQKNSARVTREGIRLLRSGTTGDGGVRVDLFYQPGKIAVRPSAGGAHLVATNGNCAAIKRLIDKAGYAGLPVGHVVRCALIDGMLVASLSTEEGERG